MPILAAQDAQYFRITPTTTPWIWTWSGSMKIVLHRGVRPAAVESVRLGPG